jgi:hypothetical protein
MEMPEKIWNAEYLTGLYAPVPDEIVALDLPVIGILPARLRRCHRSSF